MERLLISNTPHIRSRVTTRSIMIDVCIALLPAAIAGIVFFGWKAVALLVLSLISCVASEIVYRLIRKEKFSDIIKNFDFTSCVTGILLALNLGTQILDSVAGWFMPLIGGVFAIIVAKMIFGGTGKNFVNPALAGRIFLLISFSAAMTTGWAATQISSIESSTVQAGETVLSGILSSTPEYSLSNLDLFLGTGVAGSMGETCKAALILGGIYLVVKGVIDWKWPTIYIAVEGLTASLLAGSFQMFLPSILSGGLMLGAIFMATDYVTTPNTTLGNIIYFTVLGLITALMRFRNGSEVVSYCIFFMNFTVPLIDRYIKPRPFGYQKPPKENKEAKA